MSAAYLGIEPPPPVRKGCGGPCGASDACWAGGTAGPGRVGSAARAGVRAMKRSRNVRDLLLSPDPEWRWRANDRGIDWITSPYAMARADLFEREPKVNGTGEHLRAHAIRKILDKLRAKPTVGIARASGERIIGRDGKTKVELLRCGAFYIPINAALFDAWRSTGLTCRIAHNGTPLWYGTVRGKPALFGVSMPMHVGDWRLDR